MVRGQQQGALPMPDEKACGDWLVAEMKKLGES
jgi:hypothetical protein